MPITSQQQADIHNFIEELKKAVKATAILSHPNMAIVVHSGSLRVSKLEPKGEYYTLKMEWEEQPRDKKPEAPTE